MAERRNEKLLVVFVGFLLLFNYPLLSIFDRREIWAGFPVLYFYMFFIWLMMILALWTIVRKHKK